MASPSDMEPRGVEAVGQSLPSGWRAEFRSAPSDDEGFVVIRSPSGAEGSLRVIFAEAVDPAFVKGLFGSKDSAEPTLLVTSFMGESSREAAQRLQVSYIDLAGNLNLQLAQPGILLRQDGTQKAPSVLKKTRLRSLKGERAARVARAICSLRQIPSMRRVAEIAEVSPGYVSSVFSFLRSEALLTVSNTGEVVVEWEGLVRRWARDQPWTRPGLDAWYFYDRGSVQGFVEALMGVAVPFAVSGTVAANTYSYFSPSLRVIIYALDAVDVIESTGRSLKSVRKAELGDVFVFNGGDSQIVRRASVRDGVPCAPVTQVAVDLLAGDEEARVAGEALLDWMRANESEWRK